MAPASFNAIIDSVVRLAQSLDDNDRELIESVFTEDATTDLTGLNRTVPPPSSERGVVKGRDALADLFLNAVGKNMTTTHMLTNFRITKSWTEGKQELREVTCHALASHFKKGEGLNGEKQGYHMANRYRCELVRMDGEVDEATGEDRWRMRLFVIWCEWAEGDHSVMAG